MLRNSTSDRQCTEARSKNPRGDTPPAFGGKYLSGSSPLAAIDPRCRGCRLFNPQRRGAGRVPTAIRRTQTRPRCSMHHWSWSVQPSDDRALELLAHKITWGGARRGGAKREVAEAAGNRRSRKCGNGRDREEVGVHPQNRTARTTPVYTLTPDGAPQNPEWS